MDCCHQLNRFGFSLIELLVVLAILTTLSAISVPILDIVEVRAREKKLREALISMRQAIDRYRASRNSSGSPWPPSIVSLTSPIPAVLLRRDANPGPFLSEVFLNPFYPGDGSFRWEIRDASGTWVTISDPNYEPPGPGSGVYDVRYPSVASFDVSIDGSKYVDW
ncbi:type II secretion system protein [bacterium]|nr:type II secretion system protein [bacterium]